MIFLETADGFSAGALRLREDGDDVGSKAVCGEAGGVDKVVAAGAAATGIGLTTFFFVELRDECVR